MRSPSLAVGGSLAVRRPFAAAVPGVLADRAAGSAVRSAALVVGGACAVGLAAQIVVPLPWTPVPITGQTFAVLLVAGALGPRRGVASLGLYALAALAGLPWLAGASSAITAGALTATFGYVVGFVLAGAIVGRLAAAGWTRSARGTAAAFALGTALVYLVGVPWLAVALGIGLGPACALGLLPFLLGDALKVVLAAFVFPTAWHLVAPRG